MRIQLFKKVSSTPFSRSALQWLSKIVLNVSVFMNEITQNVLSWSFILNQYFNQSFDFRDRIIFWNRSFHFSYRSGPGSATTTDNKMKHPVIRPTFFFLLLLKTCYETWSSFNTRISSPELIYIYIYILPTTSFNSIHLTIKDVTTTKKIIESSNIRCNVTFWNL